MARHIVMIMATFKGLTDKHCCEIGENESLDKCHQDLQQVYKYCQRNKQQRRSPTQSRIHCSKNENETYKAQDDDVPGDHVREQTDDQCEGLGKDAHDFYRPHDRFYGMWN